MTRTVETRTVYGCMFMKYPDGRERHMKRTVTEVTDWQETILGPMNMGCVIFGPWEDEWRKPK